jgi:hypothetical protein
MSTCLDLLIRGERLQQALAADAAEREQERRGFISHDPIIEGLTEAQRQQHHAMLEAMRAGQLRPLPTCFGDL